jgi:hypothetical protein
MSASSDNEDAWLEAFNEKIKTKSFEQFSLLLCDVQRAPEVQKQLLAAILFNDHRSLINWVAYLEYANHVFGSRKLQLQRLLNKALELLDENLFKNEKSYLNIHLSSAALKG